MDVSVAEWLAWLTSNCGRIGAIGSSPSNGLKPNTWGQKGFNPLCQCVYIYVCIVNPDIQTIHRCSHTSIHTYVCVYQVRRKEFGIGRGGSLADLWHWRVNKCFKIMEDGNGHKYPSPGSYGLVYQLRNENHHAKSNPTKYIQQQQNTHTNNRTKYNIVIWYHFTLLVNNLGDVLM